jgi:hypothetical protein
MEKMKFNVCVVIKDEEGQTIVEDKRGTVEIPASSLRELEESRGLFLKQMEQKLEISEEGLSRHWQAIRGPFVRSAMGAQVRRLAD